MTPEEAKDKRLQKTYKRTLEQQNAQKSEQNNACAICGRSFEHYTPFQDHWHKCCPRRLKEFCGLCTRGLLCFPCNKYVVGVLERQGIKGEAPIPIVELCKRIIAYFEKWDPILAERGACEKPKVKKSTVRRKKKSV